MTTHASEIPPYLPEQMAEQILATWEKTLPGKKIELDSNFFILGGDSMLGSMLMLQLKQLTKLDLALTDLYEHSTLQALLTFIAYKLQCQ